MSQQPHPDRVRLLPWRIPDLATDAFLAVFMVTGIVARDARGEEAYATATWLSLAVGLALIALRRRYPIATLVAAVIASAVAVAATTEPSLLLPVAIVALFNVAQRFDRRTALIAGGLTTASFLLMITLLLEQDAIGGSGLASIAWPAFGAAAGAAVRSTRESVTAAQERAVRAEESRELEAQRRVVEERLRIARDVHDLVAHHIAVINVQSAVAGHLMETDPPAAGEALAVVRDAASTVIDQLGELLGVLRSPDEVDEPTAPTPDLAAVDDLVASFSVSGLSVSYETAGARRPISRMAELTIYRVVQEALTNAHKHGDGSATVSLRFVDDGVELEIVNPAIRSSHLANANGTGFGLIGMRERVEAIGGTFHAVASPDDQRFEIAVTIPAKDHP